MSPEPRQATATDERPGVRPVLEARGVTVRFGGVAALTDVTLSVEPGRVTGLIGPNGAGKTTLFNVITGLQRPDRGDVLIDGTDVTRYGPHRRSRLGLARTFQRLELFGTLSAADNVRVGLQAAGRHGHSIPAVADTSGARDPAVALLARVGVAEVADAQVGALPTGTARLVELARALRSGRGSSSWTSPARASTTTRPRAWAPCSATWRPRAGPCCWSSTTWTWCSRSVTSSTCWTSAR